jgi:hypothetical protein
MPANMHSATVTVIPLSPIPLSKSPSPSPNQQKLGIIAYREYPRACSDGIWGSGVIAPRILNLGTRRDRLTKFVPRSIHPRNKQSLVTTWTESWVRHRPGITIQRWDQSVSPVENRTTVLQMCNSCSGHYDYPGPCAGHYDYPGPCSGHYDYPILAISWLTESWRLSRALMAWPTDWVLYRKCCVDSGVLVLIVLYW